MGLRGGQDEDPSLDQGRCQVLTVLVVSHFLFTARTKIQATEEPGGCDLEKGEGLCSWGGGGPGVERWWSALTPPGPWAVWHIALELLAASAW